MYIHTVVWSTGSFIYTCKYQSILGDLVEHHLGRAGSLLWRMKTLLDSNNMSFRSLWNWWTLPWLLVRNSAPGRDEAFWQDAGAQAAEVAAAVSLALHRLPHPLQAPGITRSSWKEGAEEKHGEVELRKGALDSAWVGLKEREEGTTGGHVLCFHKYR